MPPTLAVDGHGEYELAVHQVGRGRDNSQKGVTTSPVLEAYRLGVAWQNVGYNQPPHVGFHLGPGMRPPPRPRIATPGGGR